MFAQVVFIEQFLLYIGCVWVYLVGKEIHVGDFFEDDGIMYGVVCVFALGEGTMRVNKHSGHVIGCNAAFAEGLDDDFASFEFVFARDFRSRHAAGGGDRAVEVVGVGGAERR